MSRFHAQLPLDIKLRDDATFETFIGDAGRRLSVTSGIIVLWGSAGSGRSHLLQARCHAAREAGKRAIFIAEPGQHSAEVLSGLEHQDLVCIDDIDAVLGANAWEEALFHLINAVRDHDGTLIFSSNVRIPELPVALADLKSRLLGAHAIETDTLDDNQKLVVLKQKASRQGFEVNDEVGRFIMSRSGRDMRSLVTLLAKLEVETLRQQKRVTIPLVKALLGSS